MKKYLAHTANNEKKVSHLLKDHLYETGEKAEEFISESNGELSELSKWAGRLHDFGKYRDEFQDYLLGNRESCLETHHAVYGAALAFQKFQNSKNPVWLPIAFSIAAHHAGLHDKNQLNELFPKYDAFNRLSPLIELFEKELADDKFAEKIEKIPDTLEIPNLLSDPLKFEVATRMIFSSLVDADFLDTEKHYRNDEERQTIKLDDNLCRNLQEKLESARLEKVENAKRKNADENLIRIRNRIFENCIEKASAPSGFFSLTVPTGGGKTLSAMAFALEHARKYNLRRVIVVIPYLSIIEQNAKEYREIFGDDIVIENHSAVKIEAEEQEENKKSEKRKRSPLALSAENWDAPIIVTTSVQFIESLFSHKPSRCRKLHNIARSVVIFDEVQTLPPKLLIPLFSVWRELVENYGVSFVFSTATQPAFRRGFNFKNGFSDDELKEMEITENTDEIFKQLNRVKYEFKEFQKPQTWAEIAAEMLVEKQILCVVNTRKHAFELWDEIIRQKTRTDFFYSGASELFHLSSAMCAEHRLEKIAEIKKRLENGQTCRVVSTQLVEAGVDLDFPVLFRAVAPLDSIVQAAGRCNREGKLEKGRVKVFTPVENRLPPGIYQTATDETCSMLPNYDEKDLAVQHGIFADYFSRIYNRIDTGNEIQTDRKKLYFREVSGKAKVIDNEGIGVIVPYKKAKKIVEKIRMKNLKSKFTLFGKDDLRSLQRFMVNLYPKDFNILQELRQLKPLISGEDKNLELFVVDEGSYNENLGVLTQNRPTNEFYGGM